jgi:hypothetical protein
MGTWTHPALARKQRTAFRNDAVEQTLFLTAARRYQDCLAGSLDRLGHAHFASQLSPYFPAFPAVLRVDLRARSKARRSGKCCEKRIHSVNQILPGGLNCLLNS